MNKSKRIYTTCTRDCPNTCGLEAHVREGRLAKLAGSPEHPLNRGKTCVKAARYVERTYSPERVLHPMKRASIKDPWERASWDEVFDLVADKIKAVIAESGPEAILYYQGYGERTALKLLNKYFFNLLGGVTTLRGSLCGGTGQASQNLDFGVRTSHDPLDHYNSASIILWGRNPVSTQISLAPILKDVRKKGGTVVLIDPFKSRSAVLADKHIAPAPGRDMFLAMAVAKIVLQREALATEFIEKSCNGFAAYKAILDGFDFSLLIALAGVGEEDAYFLADLYVNAKPTATLLGWGMHRHEHAHYSIRAIDALAAMTGNIGVPGGGVSQGFEEYGPYDQKWWGDELNPPRRTLLMPEIADELQNADNPPVRMIVATAANPICMAPDSDKVARAFEKAELVVYSGHFLDDTTDYAHVFFPATTFLEEHDVMATYGHNYVGPVNRTIDPVGECRTEYEMFCGLAKRFDFADRFVRPVDDWLYDICAPIREQGCTMEELRKGPFRLDAPMAPYTDGVFPTESGKFEFLTEFDPSVLRTDDPEYPYTLLTIAPHKYICSERTLAEHEDLPLVLLHPDEALLRGVADGDAVWVESPAGRVKARLKTDPGIRRDCLVAERGGWIKAGHGLNRLTKAMSSKVGNGTPYYETVVTVKPFDATCADLSGGVQ